MALFQTSVVNKFRGGLDQELISQKYAEFQKYFGNKLIQDNIRSLKEEEYQGGFLRDLFVDILGYTLNPQKDFNLRAEFKNIANAKKADGAIIRPGEENPDIAEALAVIELKGTDTADLATVEDQAFGYKHAHKNCLYVITSNFERLRFYVRDSVDHEEFSLFGMTRERFELLWLCLAKDSLIPGIPLRMKESSVLEEEEVTKKLYADYSRFREDIFANLVDSNPGTDKLLLFKKTQKLLDRFLFVFFAEDRGLLPPNSISEVIAQWAMLKELDEYSPLYSRFIKFFGYMNTGSKIKDMEIFPYNGGLFAPDEVLDSVEIADDVLLTHTKKLSAYDFETEVDVNILGHIFEHSLGEIESIQEEIAEETSSSQETSPGPSKGGEQEKDSPLRGFGGQEQETSPNLSEGEASNLQSPPSGDLGGQNVKDQETGGQTGRPRFLTANPKIYALIKDAREHLKNNPTKAEKVLWEYLKTKKTGHKIRRQHIIEDFITDFLCLRKKVVFEIDGKIHLNQKEYDDLRTERLNQLGYEVIRISNEEVLSSPEKVSLKIKEILDNKPDAEETSNLQSPPLGDLGGRGLGSQTKQSPSGGNKGSQSPSGGNRGSRRKRDGIFYTPKYITKYIVENTVGRLCNEKRAQLGIIDGEYAQGRKNRQKKTIQELLDKLDAYREWLLSLTILDPACGSGAFLNQALDFLITEHGKLDKLRENLLGGGIVYPDVTNDILERNIYGVDINEESVEIAKLSLWLRTARKGRKLNSLTGNIKCGNSLIDDPAVAGDKAFNWQKEFPEVFKEKELKAFHVTWVTHNSRVSGRMINAHVEVGEPVWLTDEMRNITVAAIEEKILEEKLRVLNLNVLGDHVHLLIVCSPDELQEIVRKLKGYSSYKICRELKLSVADKGRQNNIWAKSFSDTLIRDENHLHEAYQYIENNHIKHEINPCNRRLQPSAKTDITNAFRPKYTGGFDVVIGNPPYLRIQGLQDSYPELLKYYEGNYQAATGNYDIYVLFIEKSLQLINNEGQASFILPHKFLISEFGEGIRRVLSDKKGIKSILHFEEHMVFEVSTYTCIITLNKMVNDKLRFKFIEPKNIIIPFEWDIMDSQNLTENKWNLISDIKQKLFDKLNSQPYTAKDIFSKIFQGLATSADTVYVIEGKKDRDLVKGYSKSLDQVVEIESDLMKPMLKGQNVKKYESLANDYYVLFPYLVDNNTPKEMDEDYILNKYPKGYRYLKNNETVLRNRENGRMNHPGWFLYIYPKSLSDFKNNKIITPEISYGTNLTFDNNGLYHTTTVYSFILKKPSDANYKFYLSVLNSQVLWFFLMNTGTVLRGGYFRFKTKYLFPFPLPEIPDNPQPFIDNADKMLGLNAELRDKSAGFLALLRDNLAIEKPGRKLESFHELTFADFLKETKKRGNAIPLRSQAEWRAMFEETKAEILRLRTEIATTDKEIDRMVYELYGLTEEEIKIVEGT